MGVAEADFSGYATKSGLRCSDGRTIMPDAFKHMDGKTVPLVWQHGHSEPENILGHAVLEAREDGVYAYGYFNDTATAKNARELVQHKDINFLSIYANQLVERSKNVLHGFIREVSLVLAGANPGALIDNVKLAHGDDIDVLDDEVIIYSGETLAHEETQVSNDNGNEDSAVIEHAEEDRTVKEIYDGLSDAEKDVVHYMIGMALQNNSAKHSDEDGSTEEDSITHDQEGSEVSRNVFEQDNYGENGSPQTPVLTHSDVQGIVQHAQRTGSLKAAVEDYALAHGIENIEILFPEAQAVQNTPEWDKRRTEWVAGVLNGVHKTPFSRIKTVSADITLDEARARGYIKGNLKKEEFFSVQKRTTTPTTIYKKQKLDRDDIIDITDFDVVSWMKGEMRLMLEEEIARAILVGDGRDIASDDKINETNIRPVASDHELYVTTVNVNIGDANSSYQEVIDAVLRARKYYKGTGSPTFYTTEGVIVEMLLLKDTLGRRLYNSVQELASQLRVSDIVAVEVLEGNTDLVGIVVNLADYALGADKGGQTAMFDDFDIDYNQYKYLIETRLSGALTKIKSALVVRKTASNVTLVTPTEPAFNAATGVITIPTVTGVTYKRGDTNATVTAGPMTALAAGATLGIYAVPTSASYAFNTSAEDTWSFTRES